MPSTRLTDCIPKLADLWLDVQEAYETEHPNRRLQVTCTHRSEDEQCELFKIGRKPVGDGKVSWIADDNPTTHIVTQLSGRGKNKSKHNLDPAAALDFCILIGGKVSWDPAFYTEIGELAKAKGLLWGGEFSFKDYGHLELP